MGRRASGEAAIVSYGWSRYDKVPTQALREYLWDSVADALSRAAIDPSEVDGLAVSSFGLPPGNCVTLAEDFGLQLSWACEGAFGGAGGVIMVARAVEAVAAGRARVVVCVAGDAYEVRSHDDLVDRFTPAMGRYLAPHGFGGPNGIFALVQRRHMQEYGTTREQLGRLAVTQRRNAQQNDKALLRGDMSLNDYLAARVIADPIRLYDCVMPCAGAEAIVVADPATYSGTRKPVWVLAEREVHNPYPGEGAPIAAGWDFFADELFVMAEVARDDIDFIQLYDDYPIMEAIQLEGLGFCGPGEAGSFLEQTDISITGRLPVNTGGGQLSCGQSGAGGGMIGVTEAVQQLQEEAGERQVHGATLGLCSGFGLVSYAKGLCASAMIVSTESHS